MTMSTTTEIIPRDVLDILKQRATVYCYNLETRGCYPEYSDPVRYEKLVIETPESASMETQIFVWQYTKKSSIKVSVLTDPMSLSDLECLQALLEFTRDCVEFIETHS